MAPRVLGTLVAAWQPTVAKLQLGVFGELARTFGAADVAS